MALGSWESDLNSSSSTWELQLFGRKEGAFNYYLPEIKLSVLYFTKGPT